jgi:hypothetical protein
MEPPWLALLLSIKLIGTVRGPPWRGSTVRSCDTKCQACSCSDLQCSKQLASNNKPTKKAGRQTLTSGLVVSWTGSYRVSKAQQLLAG